jgi:hypothetical protein
MQAKVLLCDHAQVAQSKLFISGANINRMMVAPNAPHVVNVALAIEVMVPWNATNQAHSLTVELVSDGGARIPLADMLPPDHDAGDMGMIVANFNVGRSPDLLPGEDTLMPIALPFYGLPLPQLGSYFFVVRIDGTEVDRVSFRISPINPAMFGQGF